MCKIIFRGTLEFAGLPSNLARASVQTLGFAALVTVQVNSQRLPNHCKPAQVKMATQTGSYADENLMISYKFFWVGTEYWGDHQVWKMIYSRAGRRVRVHSLLYLSPHNIWSVVVPAQRGHAPSGPGVCRRHLQSLAGTGAATQSAVNKHCALSLSVRPSASFTNVYPSAARWLRSAPLSLLASLLVLVLHSP